MIERYFSTTVKDIGKTEKTIYTAPDDMHNAFVTGLYVSNTGDRNTWVEVKLYQKKSNITINLTSAETPLPAGSTAAIAALGQRLQLTSGDYITVKIGLDKSADAMLSVSEIIFTEDELKLQNSLK